MTDRVLRIRTYASLDEIQGLLPAWDALLTTFACATTFCTWEWLVSWWRAYGRGQRLNVLAFLDAHENLAALAPFAVSTRRNTRTPGIGVMRLMGDGSRDSDNLDLPVLPGYEEAFIRALLEYLKTHSTNWDVCQVNTLPERSPAGKELLAQLRQRGWPHHTYRHPCVAIPLPGTWQSYLAGLSSKERGKVGYRLRRLEKHHKVRFHRCTAEQELDGCLDALFRLHQMRWRARGEPGAFRSIARRRFYQEMARLFLGRGWLELWLLEVDGNPVAAQYGFRYRDTVYQLQEGYDPAYSSDSVGYVLRGYVLKQLIAEGVRRYDFLGGEGPNKTRWGAKVGTYLSIHFSRPNHRGRFSLGLMHGTTQSKEWLRQQIPNNTWEVLRKAKQRLSGI